MKHTLPLFFLLIATLSLSAGTSPEHKLFPPDPYPVLTTPVDLKVYPNPAIDYISLTETQGVSEIKVFNLVGRAMKRFDITYADQQFYVGDLPKGMYLVQIKGANDKVLTTQRLHKQ
ncbi:MAG: T9SS type A sorting domain-containing protein [Phaeodactylibacter sp.]|uniref:T9SS type A sorting domain-containing protein n=1 Tax=Phaeodactylibacter sp. TaxID=1940289 RepID=UPI0032EC9381